MNRKTLTSYSVRLLAAMLLLSCLLTLGMPAAGRAWAEGEDPEDPAAAAETNLLEVYAVDPKSEYAEDLKEAALVLDCYRVADAKHRTDYDAYDFSFVGDFAKLKLEEKMDREAWTALAQQAAGIVEGGSRAQTSVPFAEGVARAEALEDGIYLLIARDKDAVKTEDYMDHRQPTAEEKKADPDAKGAIFSHADSKLYTYQFAPQLVVLPGKADMTGADQTIMSSDPGEWLHQLKVYLKPEREDRKLDLDIIKSLTEFVGPEEGASFVFRITATKEVDGKEEIVYSAVKQATFTEAGKRVIHLEKVIPVGSKVTVEEVYDGKTYRLVSSTEMPITAVADSPLEVEFENAPSEEFKPGQGVVNHFTKDPSGDWPWQQIRDESEPAK